MDNPPIGVIVPCFNQGRFAAECVRSLRAQTYANWHAVLVDDASTDDSTCQLQALAAANVAIIHLERNLGRALVRNEAVRRLGVVDYILNVDCDDRLTPEYMARLVAAMEANPRAGLAYGTLHWFGARNSSGTSSWPTTPFVFARRYMENVIPGPGVLFRATALAQTRGWRREFTTSSGEDWDIWLQVVERGWDAHWVRDAVYEYRQHTASFLARSSDQTQIDIQLNLLRLHHRAIRDSAGLDAFLSRQVIPALLDAIHGLRAGRALRIARPLLRHASSSALRLVGRHYARRLRAMVRRG